MDASNIYRKELTLLFKDMKNISLYHIISMKRIRNNTLYLTFINVENVKKLEMLNVKC